jgi:hypothetical protein
MIKNEAPARFRALSVPESVPRITDDHCYRPGDIWITNPRARATGPQERLLPRHAEAQLALATHRPRLLTTGIPDRGPTQLPWEYRRLLDELAARPTEGAG